MDAKEIFNQSRTHADSKNWNKHIAGKSYSQINPRNKDEFRTVWVKENPFTGKLQAHFTPFVPGSPPPDLPHIHPLHLQRLMTLQSSGDFF